MSPSLGAVAGWTPAGLAVEATAIRAAENEFRTAADELSATLDILPEVWTGLAADATRDALRGERQLLVDQAGALGFLSRAYDDAHAGLDGALADLRVCLDGYGGGPITVDRDSPATGPILVRGEGLDEAELQAAAEAVAAAAQAVLEADASGAQAIRDAAARLEVFPPAEATTAPVDALLAAHARDRAVVPDLPGLEYDQERALRDLLLDNTLGQAFPEGAFALGRIDAATELADNRRSAGDVMLDLYQDMLTGAGPSMGGGGLPPLLSPLRSGVGAVFDGVGVLEPELAETWDIPGRAFDATVRPMARWADEQLGWGLFHQDGDLAEQAEQDQKRFGGS